MQSPLALDQKKVEDLKAAAKAAANYAMTGSLTEIKPPEIAFNDENPSMFQLRIEHGTTTLYEADIANHHGKIRETFVSDIGELYVAMQKFNGLPDDAIIAKIEFELVKSKTAAETGLQFTPASKDIDNSPTTTAGYGRMADIRKMNPNAMLDRVVNALMVVRTLRENSSHYLPAYFCPLRNRVLNANGTDVLGEIVELQYVLSPEGKHIFIDVVEPEIIRSAGTLKTTGGERGK